MKKEDFETIVSTLNTHVEGCASKLDKIKTKNGIEEISVKEFKELLAFCKSEYEIQTKILMVDTYHILGMGNLSASQLGTFTKLLKQYASYRPDINAICKWNLDVFNLPKIPKRTKFKLLGCNVVLTSGREDIEEFYEDEETVETYAEAKTISKPEDKPESESSITKVGKLDPTTKTIRCPISEIDALMDFLIAMIPLKGIDKNSFRNKIINGKQFGGFMWGIQQAEICGVALTEALASKLIKIYLM